MFSENIVWNVIFITIKHTMILNKVVKISFVFKEKAKLKSCHKCHVLDVVYRQVTPRFLCGIFSYGVKFGIINLF